MLPFYVLTRMRRNWTMMPLTSQLQRKVGCALTSWWCYYPIFIIEVARPNDSPIFLWRAHFKNMCKYHSTHCFMRSGWMALPLMCWSSRNYTIGLQEFINERQWRQQLTKLGVNLDGSHLPGSTMVVNAIPTRVGSYQMVALIWF